MAHKFQLVKIISEAKYSTMNSITKPITPEKTKSIVSACSREEIFEKIMEKVPNFPCSELKRDLDTIKHYLGKISKGSYLFKINTVRYRLLITKASCKKTRKHSKKIHCKTMKNRLLARVFGTDLLR